MGEMPEVAIFRRFGALNAQILLYMQAELVSLEKQLHQLQARDAAAPSPRSMYAVNWFRLRNSEDLGEGDDDEQWELVKEIRVKLREYNNMLIQQRKIVCVDPPGSWDLRYMQRYLVSEDMDHGVLVGQDANVWGSEGGECDNPNISNNSSDGSKGTNRYDLLPLAARHNEDFFSSWVTESMSEKLIKLKKRRQSRKAEVTGQQQEEQRIRNLDDFADKKVLQWTFIIASVLASALPILAIVILYYVQSLKARLGLIAVFNVLVSFALACFTSAKRAEVFAVSAAFSAVQVVFVQVGANDT
ncbi:hypothetical protein SLS56_001352 [Neofusicoccum ribis]|uniref:DUF6594 domain-containing protein n=1 Tax=Neofusicoccum ribis TaxID=45134 RepID=A0ABR3T8Y2_9PEZI